MTTLYAHPLDAQTQFPGTAELQLQLAPLHPDAIHITPSAREVVIDLANGETGQVRSLLNGWDIREVNPATNGGPHYQPTAAERNAVDAASHHG